MNRYQRLVLIVAALVVVISAWTAPRVQIAENGVVLREGVGGDALANVTDVRTAGVRVAAVLGGAALLWFAARDLEDSD